MTGDSSKQYTYTGLNDGQTYWIRVLVGDNAGNIGKSAEDNGGTQIATPSANTNPYNLTTSAPTNLRTTTSLTITASATDNEQTTLYYDLYWNGSSTVTQTVQGTRGNTVTFTAKTGLTKRTGYSWKIVVRDKVGGTQNTSTRAYTNCPGNDSGCPGEVADSVCTSTYHQGITCSTIPGTIRTPYNDYFPCICETCGPITLNITLCSVCGLPSFTGYSTNSHNSRDVGNSSMESRF